MYRSFVSQNIVKNAPRSTHPVPIIPAVKPDNAHPILPRSGVGSIFHFGLRSEYRAKTTRIIPRTNFNISAFIYPTREAQTIVAIILGIPNKRNIFRSQYLQKRERREILPNI
jgi:hypothetical protein